MKERKSTRLQTYDYSRDGIYFITSCVKDRICCFGKIEDSKMILNEFGEIAENQWRWLFDQYHYIKSHAFVVMPNHIHGIIEIKRNLPVGTGRDLSTHGLPGQNVGNINVGAGRDLPLQDADGISVGTGRDPSLQNVDGITVGVGRDRPLQPETKIKSLSQLIGAYKTTTSKQIHLSFPKFEWQRSFHDHIIRDNTSFENIKRYINNNPAIWKDDTFYNL